MTMQALRMALRAILRSPGTAGQLRDLYGDHGGAIEKLIVKAADEMATPALLEWVDNCMIETYPNISISIQNE